MTYETLPEFYKRTNPEKAKKMNAELIHYLKTTEYGTYTGNRKAIETQVIQAIRKDGKIFNKVLIKMVTTNLTLNFKPTKSTVETHNKKVEKLRKEFNIVEVEQN